MNKLIASAACCDEKSVYFICQSINVIGRIELETKEINYILGPKEEPFYCDNLYVNIHIWNNQLMIIPYNAKNMYIYDIRIEKWKTIELFGNVSNNCALVSGSLLYEKCIYLLSDYDSDVIRYNLEEGIYDYPFNIKKNNDGAKTYFGGLSVAIKDGIIYIAQHYTNIVIMCDTKTGSVSFKSFDGGNFFGTSFDGKYIWINPDSSQNKVIRWDDKNESVKSYEIPNMSHIWGMVHIDEGHLLYGSYSNTYLLRDEEFTEYKYKIYKSNIITDDKTVLCTSSGEILLLFKDKEVECIKLSKSALNAFYKKSVAEIGKIVPEAILSESCELGLEEYLNMI